MREHPTHIVVLIWFIFSSNQLFYDWCTVTWLSTLRRLGPCLHSGSLGTMNMSPTKEYISDLCSIVSLHFEFLFFKYLKLAFDISTPPVSPASLKTRIPVRFSMGFPRLEASFRQDCTETMLSCCPLPPNRSRENGMPL